MTEAQGTEQPTADQVEAVSIANYLTHTPNVVAVLIRKLQKQAGNAEPVPLSRDDMLKVASDPTPWTVYIKVVAGGAEISLVPAEMAQAMEEGRQQGRAS